MIVSGTSIQRVVLPRADSEGDGAVLGGQRLWTWAVGLPFRALADPLGGTVMPASPRSLIARNEYGHSEGDFDHALGYFSALQSFLTYSFGWTRHDKGLIWWFDNGCPAEDERFALLRDIWSHDGMLVRYLAWCVQHPLTGLLDDFHPRVDRSVLQLSAPWRSRVHEARVEAEKDDLSTRPDQMHLQAGHVSGPSRGPIDAKMIGVNQHDRSAVLVSETESGWYNALVRYGAKLAVEGASRSWRVDVFVKPIGLLGTYRQSRDSGLWFAGRHAHHAVGN